MTKYEKWCKENNLSAMPIDLKHTNICRACSCCKDCPLYAFEDCNTDNPLVIKWFNEEIEVEE